MSTIPNESFLRNLKWPVLRAYFARQLANFYRWRAEADYAAVVAQEPHLAEPVPCRRRGTKGS